MQPSTTGNAIECKYKLVFTRTFDVYNCDYKDYDGIEIPITINPSHYQLSGYKKFAPTSNDFWQPAFINCETLDFKIERPQNLYVNYYDRVRERNDEEAIFDVGVA